MLTTRSRIEWLNASCFIDCDKLIPGHNIVCHHRAIKLGSVSRYVSGKGFTEGLCTDTNPLLSDSFQTVFMKVGIHC